MDNKIVRRVKARRHDSDSEVDVDGYVSAGSQSEDEFEDAREEHGEDSPTEDELSEQDGQEGGESEADTSEAEQDNEIQADLSSISFGALAKAQSSLKRKRPNRDEDEEDSKQEGGYAARKPHSKEPDRLGSIKDQIRQLNAKNPTKLASLTKSSSERDKYGRSSIEKRSSKHAPTEMSSKKAVSRRREIIELPANTFRDPRFDSLGNAAAVDPRKIQKNYAFLEEYREDEMRMLKEEMKVIKDEDRKWELEQQLKSMESKKYANKKRQEADDILAEHKKKEKEAVKQGKNPFYLKKADQKKLVLTTKFSKMSEKQREKAIEKKQKKKASKEKKSMPWSRRSEV